LARSAQWPDAAELRRERLALGAVLAPFVTALAPPLLFRVLGGINGTVGYQDYPNGVFGAIDEKPTAAIYCRAVA
jgi:hypothetical protein